jgi:hypothetical protein
MVIALAHKLGLHAGRLGKPFDNGKLLVRHFLAISA